MDRGERRRRSLRAVRRAWREYLRVFHGSGVSVPTPGHFRKRRVFGCHCAKRAYGAPKRSMGICYPLVREAVRERRVGRQLAAAWRRGTIPEEER